MKLLAFLPVLFSVLLVVNSQNSTIKGSVDIQETTIGLNFTEELGKVTPNDSLLAASTQNLTINGTDYIQETTVGFNFTEEFVRLSPNNSILVTSTQVPRDKRNSIINGIENITETLSKVELNFTREPEKVTPNDSLLNVDLQNSTINGTEYVQGTTVGLNFTEESEKLTPNDSILVVGIRNSRDSGNSTTNGTENITETLSKVVGLNFTQEPEKVTPNKSVLAEGTPKVTPNNSLLAEATPKMAPNSSLLAHVMSKLLPLENRTEVLSGAVEKVVLMDSEIEEEEFEEDEEELTTIKNEAEESELLVPQVVRLESKAGPKVEQKSASSKATSVNENSGFYYQIIIASISVLIIKAMF